jgi:hypothetical protein
MKRKFIVSPKTKDISIEYSKWRQAKKSMKVLNKLNRIRTILFRYEKKESHEKHKPTI